MPTNKIAPIMYRTNESPLLKYCKSVSETKITTEPAVASDPNPVVTPMSRLAAKWRCSIAVIAAPIANDTRKTATTIPNV